MAESSSREEQFRITDAAWAEGWRYGLRDAIDEALREYPDGAEVKIEEIRVKKRGDESFHDYVVSLTPPP
jgi:hypothetical protein